MRTAAGTAGLARRRRNGSGGASPRRPPVGATCAAILGLAVFPVPGGAERAARDVASLAMAQVREIPKAPPASADRQACAHLTIGSVRPLGSGQARIWSGDYLSRPVADLEVLDPNILALGPVAREEPVCAGRAIVPNIYGMPIDRARRLLATKGWKPVKAPRPEPHSREADLAERGVVEVASCSGTGFGFCSYGYAGPPGPLAVTTAGDDELPVVVGYEATCR